MASLAFHVAINSMISLWVYSLLPLLLFLFDSQLLPKEHEDVEVFTTDTVLLTVTCSWFCTILLDFSSMFLCEIHFTTFFFFKRMPTFFSSKRKQTLMGESANGRCSVKKVFLFATFPCSGHWLTCLARKRYSQRRLLCFPDYFTRDKKGSNSISKEFSCSFAINKFRTSTLCMILNYSAEHLKIRGNYRQLLVKDRKEKRHFLRKQANTSEECHVIPGKHVNLYQNT